MFTIIWEYIFFTVFADVLGLGALDLGVVFEVLAMNSHAATLRTGLELVLTCVNVSQSIFVFVDLVAIRAFALELERFQFLFGKSVHGTEFDCLVSFALLGAMLVFAGPWLKALLTEQRITSFALHRLVHDHGANGTHKEIGLFSLLFVTLKHMGQIKAVFISYFLLEWLKPILEAVGVPLLESVDLLSVVHLL